MSGSPTSPEDGPPRRAVFLSYAREDTAAAQRIADALRSQGVEVWFDQSELRGGDVWDSKIRRQIKECGLFVPVISAHTQSRGEGYFRLEWKLAVERTHLMAEGMTFIAPVVVDETPDTGAIAPAEFLIVQWTRLPGALPTPQFVHQVKSLLETPRIPVGTARPATADVGRALPVRKSPRRAWALIAVVVAGAVVAFFFLRPFGSKAPPGAPATPVSAARQLEAKAWSIWELQDDATRDDWSLADQFCQQAVAANPNDADAWAVQSQVSLALIIFGFDTSPGRYEAARTQAERAVRLAPDSNEAQFALANYYRRQNATRDEGVRMLRQLVERLPNDKRVLRTLASALRGQGRDEESIIYSDRAIALPGGDPIAMFGKDEALRYLGRNDEGENVIDQVLAVHPTPAGFLRKLYYVVGIHGNLDEARDLLGRIPEPVLSEEWGAYWASHIWLWRREPEKAIAVLNSLPKNYIEKGNYNGPKAYFTGLARQMSGSVDAARSDWQAALQVVEERLRAQPNSAELLGWKALLLARLGERAEGEEALRIFVQMVSTGGGDSRVVNPLYAGRVLLTMAVLGHQEEVIDRLNHRQPWPDILYSPEWDCIRGDPRFQAWLKANPPTESK
jgi:tetratricopeptide (TPR) repeat protein